MFETNFWGGVRVVNAVLPGMRARKRGLVILVGSTAAWVALPLNAFYSASKAALSRFSGGSAKSVGTSVLCRS
jgi:short-subunit dehydrogenase